MNINDTAVYQSVGQRLRARRNDLGMSQADLGEAVGMLRTSIANIEAGRQRPPLHILYRLCAALDLEVEQVLPSHAEISATPIIEVEIEEGVVRSMPPMAARFLQQLLDEAE